MSDLVATRVAGRVLVITIDREAKRNAVNRAVADELSAALDRLDDDPDIWAGVLTGTPRVFSAGSDLGALGDYVTERGGEYGIIRRERKRPLVAAVEGMALGGGMEIVLACDLVVAASTATFGLPEVRRGLIPTCAGLFRTMRALPVNLAKELVLTGEPIDAERAHAAGFVNRVVAPGAAVDEAVALAEQICTSAPVSVQASLAAMQRVLAMTDELGWEVTAEALDTITGSADTREGMAAFFEKRPPVWTGR